MFRSLLFVLVVAGCGSLEAPSSQNRSSVSPRQPMAGDEVHRGLVSNQKSSPDSGQASEGDRGGIGSGIR